ncbi:MAG: signal peptidase II, partial [Bacteroidota bacterium]
MSATYPPIENPGSPSSPWRRLFSDYKFYWAAFVVVMIDQIVKLAVKFNMQLYDEVKVIGETFSINFIENKGAAFGLTIADLGEKIGIPISEETAKLILTLFSIFAVIVIIYLLRQVKDFKSPLPWFLALILGGAVGNIVDRVFYGVWFAGINNYEGGLLHGRVVDMFYLDFYQGEFLDRAPEPLHGADPVPVVGGGLLRHPPLGGRCDRGAPPGVGHRRGSRAVPGTARPQRSDLRAVLPLHGP